MNREILEKIKIDFFGWLSQGATQWCLITSPFCGLHCASSNERRKNWQQQRNVDVILGCSKRYHNCYHSVQDSCNNSAETVLQVTYKKLAWSSNLISHFFPLYLSLQQQQCLCMAEGASTHDDNTAPEGQGIWQKTHSQACPLPLSRISYSRYWHVADHNQGAAALWHIGHECLSASNYVSGYCAATCMMWLCWSLY